ncbi:MAG: Asp-tRNA(Asn)/Glu-tRNA(Gln) amidotransferase subunit GatB [Ruminococcus sp.]|nr:Asp-tRNA(Asn)/Glu-tRNA(Gln) amidotransferase subunit GatB [Ruminococcus sp.]
MKYKMTAGFETHVELKTNTKIFCSCSTEFGGEPNSRCCPVCVGMPGTMPSLNRKAVEFAVKAGLALNCKISNVSYMDRKNYSYPDLPKAYQISQFDVPLCYDGFVELSGGKKIGITRIHIEEDAGKLIHKDNEILIDYNRAGVPLIEIVSEPDINSIEEAKEYVDKLRKLMRYIDVSDCRMQEGSMRCDVNVSVSATDVLGTRTEIKNMNSIANIAKAMEYEANRQIDVIESGAKVLQETLGFDEKSCTTYSMRSKEDADDYRFFREPDLLPIHICCSDIERIRQGLPELPGEKLKRYATEFDLEQREAELIIKYPKVAEFFEKASDGVRSPKKVANFILGVIFAFLKSESLKEEFNLKITPKDLKDLVLLIESGNLNHNKAKVTLEQMLLSGKNPQELLADDDLQGISEAELVAFCANAIESNSKIVADYKGGKTQAVMALVGFVMRESKGRANAEKAKEKLMELIK